MIVDELITLLKFDVGGMAKAEAFDKILSNIEGRSKEIVLGLTGVITSVGYFADRVSKSVAQNYEWAKSNGVVADSYQRLEHAATIVGGSLDDMKSDLEDWVRSAKASGQTLEEVFLRETDNIKGMTAEQSRALLKARGYSDTSIKLIQQGEGKLKEFLAEAQVIPEGNLKAAEDYAKTWREVSSQVSQLMTSAVASALPALRDVLEIIRTFVQKNKELVKSTVTTFFKSVAIAVKILFLALSPLVRGIVFLLKLFDLATFGIGKYVVIIGTLTAAFIALGIAATIKAAKGIVFLMHTISMMITVASTFFTVIIPALVEVTAATWAWTAALLANPATWIVLAIAAAVAALGAAIYAIIKYWDEIVAAIDWCWQKIKTFFSWWWSSTVKFWSGAWNKITGFASKIWGIFVEAITKLWNYINGVSAKLWNLLPVGVQNFLKGVYSKTTGVVKNIWNKITSVFSKIGLFFAKPLKDIWKSTTGVIDKIWSSIKGLCSKISETVKQAFLKPIDFVLGLLTSAINSAIDGINAIIRGLNELPGVDIPEIGHVDLRIKDKKEEDKKEEDKEKTATLSQQEKPATVPTVQESIIEQSTMSQEQPKQQLARQTSLPPIEEKDSQYWQRKYDSLVALRDQRSSEDRSARMREEGIGQDSAAAWNAKLASVAANKTQALQREMYAPQNSSGVRLYDPRVQQSAGSQKPGQSGVDRLARILDNAAPANLVAVPATGVATATPGQVTNNNQRSASYVDQRNITINTNATSGPAIANHLRGTNDMMSSGIGMAGAY